MSINRLSTSRRFTSVTDQIPRNYFSLDEPFPEYSQIQRIPASVRGINKLIFDSKTIDPNLFLSSKATLKVSISVQNEELNAAGLAFVINDPIDSESVILKKPGMVLANSMSNIKLLLNNQSVELNNPRYWNKHIVAQHAGKTLTEKYLSTSGSSYPLWNGSSDIDAGLPKNVAGANTIIIGDHGIVNASESAFQDIGEPASSQTIFNFTEDLNIGCFNPFRNKKSEIFSKSWYKKMTNLIPYIRQTGLNIDLHDLAANTLFYMYSRRGIAIVPQPRLSRLITLSIVSAELVLEWIKPRRETILHLPPKVRIQSWYIDHREFELFQQNGSRTLTYQAQTDVSIQNLILHQVPTYMLIYATINKDDTSSYQCISYSSSRDIVGLDRATSEDTNSGEPNLQIVDGSVNIRVNVLGGYNILDQNYNNDELYKIATDNSIKDIVHSKRTWQGGEGRLALYPSNSYILLGERDIKSYFVRKGQTISNLVLNIDASFTNQDGAGISKSQLSVGGDRQYNLHVDFIYDRYYIELDNCGKVFTDFDSSFL